MTCQSRIGRFGLKWTITLLFGIAGSVSSTPIPVIDLATSVRNSEIVAIGRLTSIQSAPAAGEISDPNNNPGWTAHFVPQNFLKGVAASLPSDIVIHYGSVYATPNPLITGSTRIVFLIRTGNELTPTTPYSPMLPASDNLTGSDGLGLLDEVSASIASTLNSAAVSDVAKAEALSCCWNDHAKPLPTEVRAQFLRFIQGGSAEPERIAQAIMICLQHGDLDPLPQAVAALAPGTHRSDMTTTFLLQGLSVVKDPNATESLETVAKSPELSVKIAAVTALSGLPTTKVIPLLANWLDDPQQKVRMLAAAGLGRLTNQRQWGPVGPSFQEQESTIISYWKQWLAAHPDIASGGQGQQ